MIINDARLHLFEHANYHSDDWCKTALKTFDELIAAVPNSDVQQELRPQLSLLLKIIRGTLFHDYAPLSLSTQLLRSASNSDFASSFTECKDARDIFVNNCPLKRQDSGNLQADRHEQLKATVQLADSPLNLKIRALELLQCLSRALNKAFYPYWDLFFSEQPQNTLRSQPAIPSLNTIMLFDPNPRARICAAATVAVMLEGSKDYLAIAHSTPVRNKINMRHLLRARAFTTLSEKVALLITELHRAFFEVAKMSDSLATMTLFIPAIHVLVLNTTYTRLKIALMPDLVRRLLDLSHEGRQQGMLACLALMVSKVSLPSDLVTSVVTDLLLTNNLQLPLVRSICATKIGMRNVSCCSMLPKIATVCLSALQAANEEATTILCLILRFWDETDEVKNRSELIDRIPFSDLSMTIVVPNDTQIKEAYKRSLIQLLASSAVRGYDMANIQAYLNNVIRCSRNLETLAEAWHCLGSIIAQTKTSDAAVSMRWYDDCIAGIGEVKSFVDEGKKAEKTLYRIRLLWATANWVDSCSSALQEKSANYEKKSCFKEIIQSLIQTMIDKYTYKAEDPVKPSIMRIIGSCYSVLASFGIEHMDLALHSQEVLQLIASYLQASNAPKTKWNAAHAAATVIPLLWRRTEGRKPSNEFRVIIEQLCNKVLLISAKFERNWKVKIQACAALIKISQCGCLNAILSADERLRLQAQIDALKEHEFGTAFSDYKYEETLKNDLITLSESIACG